MTTAQIIHEGWRTKALLEESLDERFNELVDHISTDEYDNSLEVYFVPDAPATLMLSLEDARDLQSLGFERIWLNFADGTEQFVSYPSGAISLGCRVKKENPKWAG